VTFTPRAAITLVFIAFGVMVGAQIGAIPVLKVNAGVDAFAFGILTGLGTAANILALALGGWVNKRFDHRSVILFILPVAFVALVASLLVNSVFTFGLTVVLFSFCLGTLDIFMNAEAGVVEHDLKKPVFSSFHASVLYGIGLSGLGGGYIAVTYGAIWAALIAVPFLVLAMMAVNAAIPHRVEVHEDAPAPAALPRKILIIIGIVIGLDVAAELTCIQWSGQMLAEMQPTLAQFSGLGVAFYGLCNGTVRLFGDRLRARFNDITLIIVSLCIGVAGFAVLATGPGFAASVAAFAVAGSGLGLIFPCLFSVGCGTFACFSGEWAAPDFSANAAGCVGAGLRPECNLQCRRICLCAGDRFYGVGGTRDEKAPLPPSGYSPNKLGKKTVAALPQLVGEVHEGRWGPLLKCQAALASRTFGFVAEPIAICRGFMASGTSRFSEMWRRPWSSSAPFTTT
jgi:MFS family permease